MENEIQTAKRELVNVWNKAGLDDVDIIENMFEYGDCDDADSFYEYVQDRIYEQEIIYYHTAIEYLKEHDPSLRISLELAAEYGHDLQNLNSELLATLLYQQNLSEALAEICPYVEDYFNALELAE